MRESVFVALLHTPDDVEMRYDTPSLLTCSLGSATPRTLSNNNAAVISSNVCEIEIILFLFLSVDCDCARRVLKHSRDVLDSKEYSKQTREHLSSVLGTHTEHQESVCVRERDVYIKIVSSSID